MKPQPKTELYIQKVGNALWIWPYSEDANLWIESEAPQFGVYSPVNFTKHAELVVTPAFDIDEVKAYLEAMKAENEA